MRKHIAYYLVLLARRIYPPLLSEIIGMTFEAVSHEQETDNEGR